MPSDAKAMLFSWREALLRSGLSPTTRHVLLTLACHMNEFGAGCFPSTRTLALETGLSRRTVETHLAVARDAGWILVEPRGASGRAWRRHQYRLSWPPVLAKEVPHVEAELGKDVLHARGRRGASDANDVAKDVRLSTSLSTSIPGEQGNGRPAHSFELDSSNQEKPLPSQVGLLERPADDNRRQQRPKQRPRTTAAPDSRHAPVRGAIWKAYEQRNQGRNCPWGPAQARNLNLVLKSCASWDVEQWVACVENRFLSEAVNIAEDPLRWVRSLASYASGPLDRYGKRIGGGNGHVKGDPEKPTSIERTQLMKIRAEAVSTSLGRSETKEGFERRVRRIAERRGVRYVPNE